MELRDEIRLAMPVQTVWDALNDPQVLQQAIPGCLSLEKVSETNFTAKVKVKIGPVSATFTGEVELHDLLPPQSYIISGSGKGGVAGAAKGQAGVRLTQDGQDCLLSYDVTASVSGKIAQLGSRLIESTAKKLSSQFFDNFCDIVASDKAS